MIEYETKKLRELEKKIETLSKEADELALKAERKGKMALIKDSNLKRKRISEFSEDVIATKAKILKLQDEI